MGQFTVIYKNIEPITDPTYQEVETFNSNNGLTLRETETKIRYIPVTVNLVLDTQQYPDATMGEFTPPQDAYQAYDLTLWDIYYEMAGTYESYLPGWHITPEDNVEATAVWEEGPIQWSAAYFRLPECTKTGWNFNGWREYDAQGNKLSIYSAGEFIPNKDSYLFKAEFTQLSAVINFDLNGAQGTPPASINFTVGLPVTIDAGDPASGQWQSTLPLSIELEDSVFGRREEFDTLEKSTEVTTYFNGKWFYYSKNIKIYVENGESVTFNTPGERTFYACYSPGYKEEGQPVEFTNPTLELTLPVLSMPSDTQGNLVNYRWDIKPKDEVYSPTSAFFNHRQVNIYRLPILYTPRLTYNDKSVFNLTLGNGVVITQNNSYDSEKIGLLVELGEDNKYHAIVVDGKIQCVYPFTDETAQQQEHNGVIQTDPAGIQQTYIPIQGENSLYINEINETDLAVNPTTELLYKFDYIEAKKEVQPGFTVIASKDDPEVVATAYWSYNIFYEYLGEQKVESHDWFDGFIIDSKINKDNFEADAPALKLISEYKCAYYNVSDGSKYEIPLLHQSFKGWDLDGDLYYDKVTYFKNESYYDIHFKAVVEFNTIKIKLPKAVAFGAVFYCWSVQTGHRQFLGPGATITVSSPNKEANAIWRAIDYRFYDSDYIGFTIWDNDNALLFDSIEKGIYRVSDSSRYNENLLPNFTDKTQVAPGADGTYYFTSQYTNRQISVSIAYDYMTEAVRKELVTIMARKKPFWLVFDEYPYKKYLVKAQSAPTLKWIPFNDPDNGRIYKGEGTLTFVCYNPYAMSRFKFIEEYEEDYLKRNIVNVRLVSSTDYDKLIDLANNGKLLVRNYFSTTDLGLQTYGYSPLSSKEVAAMSEAERNNTVFYYWQYGCIDEWWPQAVDLASNYDYSYDTFQETPSGTLATIYNPGDVDTDFILTLKEFSGNECSIYLEDKMKMKIDTSNITSGTVLILDTKQHCLYSKDASDVITYYNDRITYGDFFKIPTTQSQIYMKVTGVSAMPTIEYKYLYI